MPDLNKAFNAIRNYDKSDGRTRTWGEWFDNKLNGTNHPYKQNNDKITKSDWDKFVTSHASLTIDGKKYLTQADASRLYKDAAGGTFGIDSSGLVYSDPTKLGCSSSDWQSEYKNINGEEQKVILASILQNNFYFDTPITIDEYKKFISVESTYQSCLT